MLPWDWGITASTRGSQRGSVALLFFEALWNLSFKIVWLHFPFCFRRSYCLNVGFPDVAVVLKAFRQPLWELSGELGFGANAVSPRVGSARCFLFLRRLGLWSCPLRLGIFEERYRRHAAEVHSGLFLPSVGIIGEDAAREEEMAIYRFLQLALVGAWAELNLEAARSDDVQFQVEAIDKAAVLFERPLPYDPRQGGAPDIGGLELCQGRAVEHGVDSDRTVEIFVRSVGPIPNAAHVQRGVPPFRLWRWGSSGPAGAVDLLDHGLADEVRRRTSVDEQAGAGLFLHLVRTGKP